MDAAFSLIDAWTCDLARVEAGVTLHACIESASWLAVDNPRARDTDKLPSIELVNLDYHQRHTAAADCVEKLQRASKRASERPRADERGRPSCKARVYVHVRMYIRAPRGSESS